MAEPSTSTSTRTNDDFIACWNQILTPKWVQFRHLLSGNGKIHSDVAFSRYIELRPGQRVLDIGCGFGETCLEIGQKVGPQGQVTGIDCTAEFLAIANRERDQAGATNVRYIKGDAQDHAFAQDYFDLAFSRFGIMFFASAVRALRNARRALKPGGRMMAIVWRTLTDNPCWGDAKQIALRHLPPPGDGAMTCGPGPFSMADEDTDRAMFAAAGFAEVDLFERMDLDICIGCTIEEAIDYQILVGPSGEIIREAGDEGQRKLPTIRSEMAEHFRPFVRADGQVWMPSSTWVIGASKS
jgi:SAM-dependent methyltransferase